MTALLRHASFEWNNGLRNRALLLLLYLFPLGFYLMAGSLMVGLNPEFRETLIPAMVLFAVMAGMLLGLPDPLVSAREAGIFRSYKIHGVPEAAILLLPAFTALLHLAVVGAVITATASLIFAAPLPVNWLAFGAVFLVSAAALAGLGLVIAVISATTRATILWSQLLFLPSVMLGGLMVPAEAITGWLADVSTLLPTTYGMNAMRGLAYQELTAFSPWGSLLVLAAGAVTAIVVAVYLFQWDSRGGTRRGHALLAALALVPYVAGMLLL